jgi:hypothetical protein
LTSFANEKEERMKKTAKQGGPSASQRITQRIAELGDWRGRLLARLRKLILDAAPGIAEEWKWGTAVWTNEGLVCSAGAAVACNQPPGAKQ